MDGRKTPGNKHSNIQPDIPHKQAEFVSSPSALLLKLEIIHCPSTFVFWEVGEEVIVVLRLRLLLGYDCCEIFAKVKDNVFMLLL